MAGERRAEVTGRVNANGLLAEQEAVRLSRGPNLNQRPLGYEATTTVRATQLHAVNPKE